VNVARSVARLLIPAILLTAAIVRAEQQPDPPANSAQSSQASSVLNLALVPRPTDHPRVSRDLSQLWMAPDKRRVRTAAEANLATAIKFETEGSHAKALTLLSHPATAQQGPLASYVEYYKGLAQLHLGRAPRFRRFRLTS
jgi:hypothetical protein